MTFSLHLWSVYYRRVMFVISDRNYSHLYYKTMILANLVLAMSVNYDHKVCCKLKCTFTIVKNV
jgi:hypothetical protein